MWREREREKKKGIHLPTLCPLLIRLASRDSEDFATSCYGMPWEFYADFTEVAADEARHLGWCVQRLKDLGYDYGCMPAHDSLWQCAEATRECLEARLAVVPMVQEARGLDAGKGDESRADGRRRMLLYNASRDTEACTRAPTFFFSLVGELVTLDSQAID